MEEILTQAGLTTAQAQVYLYLLEHGASSPPTIAKHLSVTRSNAYKILDSLQEIGLTSRLEVQKKFIYKASDPSALAELVAEERNRLIALEHNLKDVMVQLRARYQKSTGSSKLTTGSGARAMIHAYERQTAQKQPIFFIKSRADIPFLGFDAMNEIRTAPAKYGTSCHGITPDSTEAPLNPDIDKRANLTRTWIKAEDYTAPVEWTVSDDELLIMKFDGEGEYIRISDGVIAESFRQIWQFSNEALRSSKGYAPHGVRAKRKV